MEAGREEEIQNLSVQSQGRTLGKADGQEIGEKGEGHEPRRPG